MEDIKETKEKIIDALEDKKLCVKHKWILNDDYECCYCSKCGVWDR